MVRAPESKPPGLSRSNLPAEAMGAPPGPRSVFFKVLSAALSGALIVLLFVAIIPQLADFADVWDSVKEMRPSVVLLFLLMALAIRLLLAEAYKVIIPGL